MNVLWMFLCAHTDTTIADFRLFWKIGETCTDVQVAIAHKILYLFSFLMKVKLYRTNHFISPVFPECSAHGNKLIPHIPHKPSTFI
jgi:hypothetical protein